MKAEIHAILADIAIERAFTSNNGTSPTLDYLQHALRHLYAAVSREYSCQ